LPSLLKTSRDTTRSTRRGEVMLVKKVRVEKILVETMDVF
jgi:hypothetical protein